MNKNQKGFSLVEFILVILILGLIGFVAWFVWHAKNNSDKLYNSTSNVSSSSISSNPYTNWKSFCDNAKLCFKYPSDWNKIDESPQNYAFQSPSQKPGDTTLVTYDDPYQTTPDQGGNINGFIYLGNLTNLDSVAAGLSVVGGFNQPNPIYYPSYYLVDSSLLNGTSEKIGQSYQLNGTNSGFLFTNKKSGNQATLYVIGQVQTEAQAKAWFSSPTGITGLNIMKSVYFAN